MLYRFNIDAVGIHPFAISTSPSFPVSAPPGVTNNISAGPLTYTPAATSAPNVFYVCGFHFFGTQIQISTDLFFHDSVED